MSTLTYAYAESTAIVGPLAPRHEPHAWDLCAEHAARITAPLGWQMLRVDDIDTGLTDDDEHLTALAEAVREVGKQSSGLVPPAPLQESGRSTQRDAQERAAHAENNHHPARRRGTRPAGAVGKRHLYIVPDSDAVATHSQPDSPADNRD